ncbi:hypothetical protein CMO88_00570 [Candidatus Woesearchaeota archaeon]|nr:hypothetical protein [Candidatus Woesearchaeota archaeon]|tara:strand:- start:17280 stop:17873 length:594 start_codon:yes stop_codon:yes gene_type:complete
MPVYIRIPNLSVVYRDLWVMQPLYRVTRKWLMENDYGDAHEDASMESSGEILYHIRKGTSMGPNENELRIWWRTVQNPNGGAHSGNKFYKHHIDIDWNVIQMYDIEIMREGKKEKVQKGEMIINIKPYIEMPDMSNTPLLKFFDNWFRTRLLKKNLEENKKMLYQDAYRLQGMIKKYLELKIFTPELENFHEKFEFV